MVDITTGNVARRDDHEPDYKAAMLYHSDRADAYMVERDALSARLAEVEAERDDYADQIANLLPAVNREAVQQRARAEAAEAREAKLREALIDHNDLLRSAMQIAKREGVEGEIGSTNWDAYYNRVAVVLRRHHETANEARAAIQEKLE